jgi:hypothetical protein
MYRRWSKKEIELVQKFYKTKGLSWCSNNLGRTKASVQRKAQYLNICIPSSKKWTQKEINILKQNYPNGGVDNCSINRKPQAIRAKARKLGINCDSFTHPKTKERLKGKMSFKCKKHGKVDFHIIPNKHMTPQCKLCRLNRSREAYQKKSKNPLYKYRNRINSSFHRCLKTRGFSQSCKLPYSSKQLHDYLENIKKKQGHKCPICKISYCDIKYDVDHIIPICTARTIKDIKKLFELKNLSILCWYCNRYVKRGKI